VDWAKKKILADAPDEAASDVKAVLDASGVSGADLAPRVDASTGSVTPEMAPSGSTG
jgi:hypothetical protein